jgi:predicted Zn-dependent protease
LGHELSHVTQRHISRLMTQQSRQTPWLLAAMVLGMLAAKKSPDAANAAIVGGQALAIQYQLGFSRDMEREADRVGFGVMTDAGFDSRGVTTMFEKLQQASRLSDNGAFPYLRSHPLNSERIGEAQARVQLVGGKSAAGVTEAPQDAAKMRLLHAMMASRARLLAAPGVDAQRAAVALAQTQGRTTGPVADRSRAADARDVSTTPLTLPPAPVAAVAAAQASSSSSLSASPFAPGVSSPASAAEPAVTTTVVLPPVVVRDSRDPAAQRAGALYAGALAAAQLRDFVQARNFITALKPHLAGNPEAQAALALLGTDIDLMEGKVPSSAATTDMDQLKTRAEMLVRGRGLLAAQRPKEVASRLQTWVADHPKDAAAWQLLAAAYSAQGLAVRAVRADAESRVAELDYPAALDRFKAAQGLMRNNPAAADYVEASILDTRARQTESLVKEQALQDKIDR